MTTKRCSRCKEVKDASEFSRDSRYTDKLASRCKSCNSKASVEYAQRNASKVRAYQTQWREANREVLRERGRAKARDLRRETMDAYGGFCTCCGETHLTFLTIDHIANDGAEKRRSGEHAVGPKFYKQLRDQGYPPGFQVLCFNCNWAKSHGGCPHQTEGVSQWVS